jgi:hypothetical protein
MFTKLLLFVTGLLCYISSSTTIAQVEVPYNLSSGESIAVNEATGDIFLAGYTLTEKPVKDKAGPDRFDLLDYFNKTIFISKFDKNGRQLWLKTLAIPVGVEVESTLIDELGNSYVTGRAEENPNVENQGEFDAFIAKYNVEGEQVWLRQFGTPRDDIGVGLTLTTSGEILVVGKTYTNITNTPNINRIPQDHVFLTKWTIEGQQKWLREFKIFGGQYISANGVDVDARGHIFITGQTSTERVFTDPIGINVYLAKFTEQGYLLWQEIFGSVMNTFIRAVSANQQYVFVAGVTAANDVGKRDYETPRNDSVDAVLASYNTEGSKHWIIQFGAEEGYDGKDVVVDILGNAIVVGSGNGIIGGDPLGASDTFVVQYNSEGEQVWADNLGTEAFDAAMGVATDDQGNIYVTGYLYETWDDLRKGFYGHKNAGDHVFLTKYTSEGQQVWLRTFKVGTIWGVCI